MRREMYMMDGQSEAIRGRKNNGKFRPSTGVELGLRDVVGWSEAQR